MTTYFADTSAIAKRYISERGSQWVKSWSMPSASNLVVISALSSVEISSLMARRQREGVLSQHTQYLLQTTFLTHAYKEYLTVPLDDAVMKLAREVIRKHPLRALDAIQLACAIQASQLLSTSMIFASADQRLLAAAAAEGFATDDPNAHP